MKQEILYRITSLVISLAIVLSLCILVYSNKNTYKTIIDLADKIDGLEWQIEPCRYEVELLKRNDELTRENLQQDQIIADQENQIKEFGWLKEASKNIK